MQRRQFLGLSLTGAAALTLGGCGFRLRGVGGEVLAIDSLALAGPDGPFKDLLVQQLASLGTQVDAGAPLRLNLAQENVETHQVGVLDTGSQEQQLVLTVPYTVQRVSDGAYLADRQSVEVIESFSTTDDNLLAKDDLRADALQTARREAVRQLIDRLRALPGS